jgi:hypothetical protein
MKKKMKLFGIISLAVILGFSILACSDGSSSSGNGKGNGNGNGQEPTLVIRGTFVYQGRTVTFNAGSGSGSITPSIRFPRSTGSGIDDSSIEMTGKIEDGDTIFDLAGFYVPSTGEFVLSAGSDSLVHEIAGEAAGGVMVAAEANAKRRNGNNWSGFPSNTVTPANNINITASASNDQLDGLPASWIGRWRIDEWNWLDVTPFGLWTYTMDVDLPVDILEIQRINATKFDIVALRTTQLIGMDAAYMKLRLEQVGANLLLTYAFDEANCIDVEIAGALVSVRNFDMDTAEGLYPLGGFER